MKSKALIFFLLCASTCFGQQQRNYTITYDSVKIYLKDTTVVPTARQSYFRCGLNVQTINNIVYLYANPNIPLNQWKKSVNLAFLTPTNNPVVGDSILNSLVYSGCSTGDEDFIEAGDSGVTYITPSGLAHALPLTINSYGNGTNSYTNNLLSTRNILDLWAGGAKLSPNEYGLSGTSITFGSVVQNYMKIYILFE